MDLGFWIKAIWRLIYLEYVVCKYIVLGIIFIFRWIGAKSEARKGPPTKLIPFESRFEHTHIIAGSGWGKTQLSST